MFELLLGHLVGDYLIQNDYMALNKAKNTKAGYIACLIHCITYTIAVTVFMQNFDIAWILTVFFSHFFIDKYNLADKYMTYYKGLSISKYIKEKETNPIKGDFVTLVHTAVDNTMHLVLMYAGYQLLYF